MNVRKKAGYKMSILYIFLGWLLGLSSLPITERIKRHYQKQDVRCGIISELKEMKVRLVLYIYLLTEKIGTYDKELIAWTKEHLAGYEGSIPTKRMLSNLEKMSKASNDQLKAVQSRFSRDEGGFSLKKLHLPFLESKIDFLPLFSSQFQSLIYNIRSGIQIINEDVENGVFYHRLTFDSSLTSENHERVLENIKSGYENMRTQAKTAVEKISELITRQEPSEVTSRLMQQIGRSISRGIATIRRTWHSKV